jgi:transcriptional antiterminator RfaH
MAEPRLKDMISESCIRSVRQQTSHWRVFYTRPRAEKKCELSLIAREINVFLPKWTIERQWTDRKKKVLEVLFPNYIFACVNERERIEVLRTVGILRCLSFAGKPTEVRVDEIEKLSLLQAHPELIEAVSMPLPHIGAEVLVAAGPLQGLRGEIMEYRGQTRIIVRVASIKQCIKVEVPAHLLRPA